jgi:hypothetical protein
MHRGAVWSCESIKIVYGIAISESR